MHDRDADETAITNSIIGAFRDVCNALGFGFLEHVDSLALARELRDRDHAAGREVAVPVMYKAEVLTHQRLDLMVDGQVLVEVKSTRVLPLTAKRQVLNYPRATSLEVGLLLHFGPEARFYRLVQSLRVPSGPDLSR